MVYDYTCMTLEQLSREVWTLHTGYPSEPADILVASEMAKLHALRHSKVSRGVPHIPAAIQSCLDRLGWTWPEATFFRSNSHGSLDLVWGSPAKLKHVIASEWQDAMASSLSASRPEFIGWRPQALATILRSKGRSQLSGRAKRRLLSYMGWKTQRSTGCGNAANRQLRRHVSNGWISRSSKNCSKTRMHRCSDGASQCTTSRPFPFSGRDMSLSSRWLSQTLPLGKFGVSTQQMGRSTWMGRRGYIRAH